MTELKFKKVFYILICFLLISTIYNSLISGAYNTEFITDELTDETKYTFLDNINFVRMNAEPQKRKIECFDVCCNNVAVGFSESDNKTVCIYNTQGEFQYGYRFKTNGQFAVELDEYNLIICFVRSDILIKVNSYGDVIEVEKIQDTTENNKLWNEILYSTEKTMNGSKYILDNKINFLASSYSKLIVIDEYGNENVIYRADSSQTAEKIVTVFAVLLLAFLIVSRIRADKNTDNKVTSNR